MLESIIQDCINFLFCLPNVIVVFVRKSKNAAAHELASLARIVGAKSWVGCAWFVLNLLLLVE
jgi:hypothetical protein